MIHETLDTILLAAMALMLGGSTYMGMAMRRSMHGARESFNALVRSLGELDLELTKIQNRLTKLEKELDR